MFDNGASPHPGPVSQARKGWVLFCQGLTKTRPLGAANLRIMDTLLLLWRPMRCQEIQMFFSSARETFCYALRPSGRDTRTFPKTDIILCMIIA